MWPNPPAVNSAPDGVGAYPGAKYPHYAPFYQSGMPGMEMPFKISSASSVELQSYRPHF